MNPILKTIKNSIPNTVTCLNLLSGTIAIVLSFAGKTDLAVICIICAAVFDFLDGMCARLLNAQSSIGKELDSLSDLVSFGVAPAMLVMNALAAKIPGAEIGISAPWYVYAPLITVPFGALRLAKFNTDTRQTSYFIGLPIPANAIFWIGIWSWIISDYHINPWVLTAIALIMSLLMVSEIKMVSLKFKSLAFGDNVLRYMLIIGVLTFIICYSVGGLVWAIAFYVLLSAVCSRYIK